MEHNRGDYGNEGNFQTGNEVDKDPVLTGKEETTEKTADELWAEKLGIPAMPPPTPSLQNPAPPRPEHGGNEIGGNFGTSYPEKEPASGQAPQSYLIWSILTTLFCCFIPGIIAVVFSSRVSSRWYAGDCEGAEKASRQAQIWILISFVLGLVSNTIAIPLMLV